MTSNKENNTLSVLQEKLDLYAKNELNVLLIGTHGIGKSTLVKDLANKMKCKFKYYSASTLDPYADLVGIPAPNRDTKYLDYFKHEDLVNCEFLMFDELNRAHPKVLNAVLEIIQFKSINGERLPNLKMVWAAMNPPGESYEVENLDPALVDRFHIYIKLQAEINEAYLSSKMKPEIARALKKWWELDLSDDQRRVFTPRRAEYVGMMVMKNIPWRDALPQGHLFPVDSLEKRIKVELGEEKEISFDKAKILNDTAFYIKLMKESPKTTIPISKAIAKFTATELFEIRDIAEGLPAELLREEFNHKKFILWQRSFKEMFEKQNINVKEKYPKIFSVFFQDLPMESLK